MYLCGVTVKQDSEQYRGRVGGHLRPLRLLFILLRWQAPAHQAISSLQRKERHLCLWVWLLVAVPAGADKGQEGRRASRVVSVVVCEVPIPSLKKPEKTFQGVCRRLSASCLSSLSPLQGGLLGFPTAAPPCFSLLRVQRKFQQRERGGRAEALGVGLSTAMPWHSLPSVCLGDSQVGIPEHEREESGSEVFRCQHLPRAR